MKGTKYVLRVILFVTVFIPCDNFAKIRSRTGFAPGMPPVL